MTPRLAPGQTWELRLRWGARALAAELLGPDRRVVRLGNTRGDDVDTGSEASVRCELQDDGALALVFSSGVQGAVALRGDGPAALSQVVARGLALEGPGPTWKVVLRETDEAQLQVGQLSLEVRRTSGRLQRLAFDWRVLALLAVALIAIGLLVAAALTPPPPMHLPKPLPARRP